MPVPAPGMVLVGLVMLVVGLTAAAVCTPCSAGT
jgi:hypothetical protein